VTSSEVLRECYAISVRGNPQRDKLIRASLLEEVRAAGSLPVWLRDDDSGPMALRITKSGLEEIDVEDRAVAAPKETRVRSARGREVEEKRTVALSAKPAGKPAEQAAGNVNPQRSNPGSKQACVIAMPQSPAGATIAAMMKATGWQQHSVRGFLAGVVRKRLKLKLDSKKVDGRRVYQITVADGSKSSLGDFERLAAIAGPSCDAAHILGRDLGAEQRAAGQTRPRVLPRRPSQTCPFRVQRAAGSSVREPCTG
jgi:Protein of unknown function (DUF3489)